MCDHKCVQEENTTHLHKSYKSSSGLFAEIDWAHVLPAIGLRWYLRVQKGTWCLPAPLSSHSKMGSLCPIQWECVKDTWTKPGKWSMQSLPCESPKVEVLPCKELTKKWSECLVNNWEVGDTLEERSRAGGRKPHNASCLMEPCHTQGTRACLLSLIIWLIWWFHVCI